MSEIIGIDHIYITVSNLERSEAFYDVLMKVLGFRKSKFLLNDDRHIQYYNRHFGYVLRPARNTISHNSYTSGLHHYIYRLDG